MKNTILVTGAGGYLGRGIVPELQAAGWRVVVADFSLPEGLGDVQVRGDVYGTTDFRSTFGQVDVLLDLAVRQGFLHDSPTHLEDLPLHYDLATRAIEGGISDLVVMGTMHEVGFFEGCVREDTPCWPTTLYGIAKNALRQACEQLCTRSGVAFRWLRGFYIVGAEPMGRSVFSKIAAADERGDATFPLTSGKNQYDFVTYEDFCRMVRISALQTGESALIHLCSGEPERLGEQVEAFIDKHGMAIRPEYGAYPDRPYDSKAIWGDSSAIDALVRAAGSDVEP
jgi:dTDP-6-deoxy-L-talose 4-dehydrogenase (NAD+)